MAGEWETATVEEIKADTPNAIAMGPFGSRIKTDNFVSAGVPVIRGNNLNGERLLDDQFVFLTEDKANELRASNVFPGDIVITHRGTLGQVGIIPYDAKHSRYVVSQSQMKLTVDRDRVDPFYVFYYLRSPLGQHELLANTSQTGVPAIARPTASLKAIAVPLPPLAEQRAIVYVLGSLDDKIELNRRMNETLEETARAIFKSWFVDFDPVRAKAEGRDPGLPKHIADLFPDRFEDSEMGEIPAGWKIDTLDNLMELAYGKALKQSVRKPGDVAVYGSNGQVGWHDERLVKGPGVVVGRKGNPGFVTWSPADFFPIDTTFYVVPTDKRTSLHFLFYALKNHNLPSLAADSAVPGLNRNFAYQNQQIVPSASVLDTFNRVVEQLFRRIYEVEEESSVLASIRDALLPRLISGELRVRGSSLLEGTD